MLRFRLLLLLLASCGPSGDSTDAGPDVIYGHKPLDAGAFEAEAAVKVPLNRMQPHADVVLPAAHIRAVYIGQPGVDGSQSFDAYMTWLVTSTDYWGAILAQYGVGYGTFDGSTLVDAAAFFTPGMLDSTGTVNWAVLDKRVGQVIHEQGFDAGVSDDAGDGGEAGASLPPIPRADGYVFFLSSGVIVDLGQGSSTCTDALGYHSWDGLEPYAIIPDCGRKRIVVSHEIAEMVTDPEPGLGWFSDTDSLGEIGDLCNYLMYSGGNQVTALWSNKDGDCEPQ